MTTTAAAAARAAFLAPGPIDAPLARSLLGPGALPGSAAAPGGRLLMVGGTKRVRVQSCGAGQERQERYQEYPSTTDQWCWYCCHPFHTRPLPLPIKYDSHRDTFHVMGTFCSFACMKAYNGESTSYLKHVNANNITLFHKRATGKLRGIKPAPPRVALRVFGGHMSIEEFRAAADTPVEYCVLPPRMIVHSQAMQEVDRSRQLQRPHRPAPDLREVVSFTDVSTKNETLRLKRPKPLQNNKNLLERTMGISAFAKP